MAVLLVEETRVPVKNYRPSLSHKGVSIIPRYFKSSYRFATSYLLIWFATRVA